MDEHILATLCRRHTDALHVVCVCRRECLEVLLELAGTNCLHGTAEGRVGGPGSTKRLSCSMSDNHTIHRHALVQRASCPRRTSVVFFLASSASKRVRAACSASCIAAVSVFATNRNSMASCLKKAILHADAQCSLEVFPARDFCAGTFITSRLGDLKDSNHPCLGRSEKMFDPETLFSEFWGF